MSYLIWARYFEFFRYFWAFKITVKLYFSWLVWAEFLLDSSLFCFLTWRGSVFLGRQPLLSRLCPLAPWPSVPLVSCLPFTKVPMMSLCSPADNPGWAPHLKMLSSITLGKSFFFLSMDDLHGPGIRKEVGILDGHCLVCHNTIICLCTICRSKIFT